MGKKNSLLIVDDEPDVCWALENILKKNGFDPLQASNGFEALALTKVRNFQLFLLDAKLPDIDGLELAKQIKSITPTTCIVMVSGYFGKDDLLIKQALEEKIISDFIVKPFVHQDILNMIKKLGCH